MKRITQLAVKKVHIGENTDILYTGFSETDNCWYQFKLPPDVSLGTAGSILMPVAYLEPDTERRALAA